MKEERGSEEGKRRMVNYLKSEEKEDEKKG